MSRIFVYVEAGCCSKRSASKAAKSHLGPVPEAEGLETPLVGQHR